MNKIDETLIKLQNGEMTSKEAYDILYSEHTKPGKRAHFLKMKVHVTNEGKGLNIFLRILFAIPIPLVFAKIGLRLGKRFVKNDDIDFNEVLKLLNYSKYTKINIDSDEAKISINII
jgi:hypothetical protein